MIKRLLRRVFLKNWGLKVFSVLMAFILWLVLVPQEKVLVEKTLSVPLEAYNIPARMELVEKPLPTVEVTIRAPNRLINQITGSNLAIRLDLENAIPFQEDYPLYPDMLNLPSGAEVVRIFPSRVHLRLEETKTLTLSVVPTVLRDTLRPGYRLEKVEVTPDQVQVTGPRTKFNAGDKVRTVPIDLAPFTQTTEIQADLILPRPDLRLAANQMRVKVRLVIQPVGSPESKPAARH
jgi:YbbR domain-containing protein